MRKCGILLPVSSLPSPYGIGTLGKEAFEFVDFLKNSAQHFWQILPLGHTGYGDSPYQCFSAFAGNPYYIDLDVLCKDGLIEEKELPKKDEGSVIDYGSLYKTRIKLLKKAAEKVDVNSQNYIDFCHQNKYWLDDYSLFMSVKFSEKMRPLFWWDDSIRCPDAVTLDKLKTEYHDECRLWESIQFLFYSQWNNLKKYANARNIEIIGDVPIYVSSDSCEFWLHNELFITDEDKQPSLVSGCPPDRFSPLGQLWGNPLYDWEKHRQTQYHWWIERLRNSSQLFDVVRIDHFRGFEDYYAVDAKASNAVIGEWKKGPSKEFVEAIKMNLPTIRIIAEDLGNITDEVRELLRYSGFPGMKILQFAFDDVCDNEFLPHNYQRNCVAYTGTHDNPTTKQWTLTANDESLTFAKKYLNVNNNRNLVNDCIRTLYSSVSDTVIIPIQDWLNLGSEARINVPSLPSGNWKWRLKNKQLTDELSQKIRQTAQIYFRNNEENEQ